jgi:hypothetical protein
VQWRGRTATVLVWLAPVAFGALAVACSQSHGGDATASRRTAPSGTGASAASASTTTRPDIDVTPASFRSLHDMTPVRGFFVANLLGDLDGSLRVARSATGGEYPPGTVLQLIPTEAMVKHRPGFDAATRDWEFFSLAVSPSGTKILQRGAAAVVNRFGGNCASCHAAAQSKFDMVCEHDHGCAPLPVGDDVIRAIQRSDPRP